MAQPILWDLAGAVKDWLNDSVDDFSQPFTAVRKLVPRSTLEELQSLKLTVAPRAMSRAAVARGFHQVGPQIDVGVQKAVSPTDEATLEQLIAFGEELSAVLLGLTVALDGERYTSAAAEFTVFDPESIDRDGYFTGVVQVTFNGLQPR